jgi:hypothetical protein
VTDPRFASTKIAVVSRTDEPSWADECLKTIRITGDLTMKKVIHFEEIYKEEKKKHFRNLQKRTGIDFKVSIYLLDLLFFILLLVHFFFFLPTRVLVPSKFFFECGNIFFE